MADATADAFPVYRDGGAREPASFPITNAVTVYRGMLAQLQAGFLNHWDETGKFAGIVIGGDDRNKDGVLLGNTTDAIPPEGRVLDGVTLMRLSGVGGTPTQAKVGDLVFSADSDIANLTLTDTTNPPVGTLQRFRSATDVDVKLFTRAEFEAGIASGTWLV